MESSNVTGFKDDIVCEWKRLNTSSPLGLGDFDLADRTVSGSSTDMIRFVNRILWIEFEGMMQKQDERA